MEFCEVSEGRDLNVHLVVTKSLNNLRNVEQDGILRREKNRCYVRRAVIFFLLITDKSISAEAPSV